MEDDATGTPGLTDDLLEQWQQGLWVEPVSAGITFGLLFKTISSNEVWSSSCVYVVTPISKVGVGGASYWNKETNPQKLCTSKIRRYMVAKTAWCQPLSSPWNISHHPRQLLQQIKKWKKPFVPHLVGNMGHTGSIVWPFRPNLASTPAIMV